MCVALCWPYSWAPWLVCQNSWRRGGQAERWQWCPGSVPQQWRPLLEPHWTHSVRCSSGFLSHRRQKTQDTVTSATSAAVKFLKKNPLSLFDWAHNNCAQSIDLVTSMGLTSDATVVNVHYVAYSDHCYLWGNSSYHITQTQATLMTVKIRHSWITFFDQNRLSCLSMIAVTVLISVVGQLREKGFLRQS